MSGAEEIAILKGPHAEVRVALKSVQWLKPSRERALAITKLQEAMFWLEEDMKRLGATAEDLR